MARKQTSKAKVTIEKERKQTNKATSSTTPRKSTGTVSVATRRQTNKATSSITPRKDSATSRMTASSRREKGVDAISGTKKVARNTIAGARRDKGGVNIKDVEERRKYYEGSNTDTDRTYNNPYRRGTGMFSKDAVDEYREKNGALRKKYK